MDYSKLSDKEVNRKVQIASRLIGSLTGRGVLIVRDGKWEFFDPCNNPADAWPIIVGHKLSLINADDEWLCVPDDTAVDGTTGDEVQMIYSGDGHVHANPLRAAMIVFLMMQGSANVQANPARPDIR